MTLFFGVLVFLTCTRFSGTVNEGVSNASGWFQEILDREVFIDGKVASMQKLFDNDIRFDEMTAFVDKRPDVMYAALRCKYADGIVDVLQTFYSIISRVLPGSFLPEDSSPISVNPEEMSIIEKIINEDFFGTKPLFEKMLYNLFFYTDNYVRLRSTDPGFLKSVFSINLFLNYCNVKKPYIVYKNNSINSVPQLDVKETNQKVRILKNSIVQIIGIVDTFRCKHCIVDNLYANFIKMSNVLNSIPSTDIDAIKNVLRSKIEPLDSLIHNGSVNYNNYEKNMYDPDQFLFEDILEFHHSIIGYATIEIKKGRFLCLKEFYNIIKNSFNIKLILKYQNFLIEIIAHIFIRHAYNLLEYPDRVSDLQDLTNSLNIFTSKIMPSTFLLDVVNFVMMLKVLLNTNIHNDDINVSKKKLHSIFNRKFWFSDNHIKIVNDIPLKRLIIEISENKLFMSFRQVVWILSYESNTNPNHYVLKVHDIPKEVQPVSKKVLVFMTELRFVLFSLWIICRANHVEINKLELSKKQNFRYSLLCASRYLIDEYQQMHTNCILNILWPLMIHLNHVNQQFNNLNVLDITKLEHMLLLSITIIENHCFRVFKWPDWNLDVYLSRTLDPEKSLNYFKENALFSAPLDDFDICSFQAYLYTRLCFHNLFLPNSDDTFQVQWNGATTFVSVIFEHFKEEIIDYQDLVRYRLLIVRWFIAKVLLKIKYVLTHLIDINMMEQQGEDVRYILLNIADDFKNLNFPIDAYYYIISPISMFIVIVRMLPMVMNDSYVNFNILVIDNKIKELGIVIEQLPYNSIDVILSRLQADIIRFKKVLTYIKKKDEKILTLNDLSFSTGLFLI